MFGKFNDNIKKNTLGDMNLNALNNELYYGRR